jgi:hypothetical protein
MKSFVIKLEPEEKKILGWGNEQFVPFEVKPAMNVAPAFRREPLIGEAYDNMLATSVEVCLKFLYMFNFFYFIGKRLFEQGQTDQT